ncbi:hypothetical protein ACWDS7_48225, partial [Streptosporangium sp. NPDC003464]
MAVDQGQQPMSIVITAGQRGDAPQFEAVPGRIRVPRLGPGRPRTRPGRVRADKAKTPQFITFIVISLLSVLAVQPAPAQAAVAVR